MDVVVIGASGLAGAHIVRRLDFAGLDVIGTYQTCSTNEATVQLDKTDKEAVSSLIAELDPDFVVDTAAFHDVDACELQRDKAWTVNATGTWNAATASEAVDAHFLYLSTDYVFDGNPHRAPFVENDLVNPVNYYGQSKYAGEQAAKVATRWTVLRSSVIYDDSGSNFLTWVLDQFRTDATVDVVNDQINSPTWVADLAGACLRIIKRNVTGLFHAAGPEALSRYEFANRIVDAHNLSPERLNPISTEELRQRAPRPRNSSLDSSRLYDKIDYEFNSLESMYESAQV